MRFESVPNDNGHKTSPSEGGEKYVPKPEDLVEGFDPNKDYLDDPEARKGVDKLNESYYDGAGSTRTPNQDN